MQKELNWETEVPMEANPLKTDDELWVSYPYLCFDGKSYAVCEYNVTVGAFDKPGLWIMDCRETFIFKPTAWAKLC